MSTHPPVVLDRAHHERARFSLGSLLATVRIARWRDAGVLVLTAATYFVAGKLGLRLAFVNQSATAVWAPSGIALAALLIFGTGTWPAVFAGAFLVNLTTAGSLATSGAIAVGNTLEAVAGAYLVRRFAGGRLLFQQMPNLFRFVALAALLSTVISATVGVTSLAVAGLASWGDYGSIWLTWWLGDVTGDLLVAPFLLLVADPLQSSLRGRGVEAAALLVSVAAVGAFVFTGWLHPETRAYPIAFLCIPLLVWPAVRFGPREAAAVAVLLAAIAVRGTVNHTGPYARTSPNESLLLLQGFLGVAGVTALALAAAVAELREAQRRSETRVTERTRELAESLERVARSEALLSRAQQMAHVGSFRWEADADRVTWSEELYRIYGRTPGDFPGTVEAFISYVHPADRPRVEAAVERAIIERQSFRLRERIVRPDGTVRVLDSAADVVLDADGRVVDLYGVCRDVTEQQRAEEELRTLAGALLEAQDQGQRRLARELHDRTSPLLTALNTKIYKALYAAEPHRSSVDYQSVLSQSLGLVEAASAHIRSLSDSLYPPLLDDRGLLATLRWYVNDVVAKTGVHVSMHFPESLPRLSPDVEVTLFRIVQEGLSSFGNPPSGGIIQVRVALDPEGVMLELHGRNGSEGEPQSVALLGLRERIIQLGGRFETGASGARSITVTVPLAE